MSAELEIGTDGRLGIIALDRPQAINALSLPMIEGIVAALGQWRHDPEIGAVLFTGNGPKGFCSGGDVRAARALVLAGKAGEADAYFAAEYEMNGMIAGYSKPLVALTHGIVMGGGIGIAGHCGFRLALPDVRYAMPESAIGFFADVGVNAILAKAPLNRALLFLLSGISVGAADAVALGLADAVVAAGRVDHVRAGLAAAAGAGDPATAIVQLMQAETIEAGEASFCALADLLPAAAPASPAEFVERVAAIPALEDIAATLRTRSLSAMTATFHAHLEARRLMDVQATLAMDLRLARVMARSADFAEGVRAVLVDKDQRPNWAAHSFGEVDEAATLEAVKPA